MISIYRSLEPFALVKLLERLVAGGRVSWALQPLTSLARP